MNKWEDPYDTPEYQAFVEEMAKECTCERERPCDGLLAGGPCDNIHESSEDRLNREQAEREDSAYENHLNKEMGV